MGAVWIRLRSEARARWRGWLALALITALATGLVMASFAGARRTSSAVDRFLVATGATHVDVGADPSLFPRIVSLPQVESGGSFAFMFLAPTGPDGSFTGFGSTITLAETDSAGTPGFDRLMVIAGRMFDRSANEVVLTETAARALGRRIGDEMTFVGLGFDQIEDALRGDVAVPSGPTIRGRVAGIVRMATDLRGLDIDTDVIYDGDGAVVISPAMFNAVRDEVGHFEGLALRLRNGEADVPAFEREVMRITGGEAEVILGSNETNAGREAKRGTQVEAFALVLFGSLIALATLLILGQAFSRLMALEAQDHPTLRALGVTAGQLLILGVLRAALIAVPAAALAFAVASLLSPLTPIGLARRAEPSPGFAMDGLVLPVGVAAVVLVVLAAAAVPAWRSSRALVSAVVTRRSAVAGVLASSGFPPTAVSGVRLALERGSGRTAVPIRSTVAGSALAIAALAAAFTYGASLSRFSASPFEQGWNWDVAVGNPHSDDVSERAIALLGANPLVGAFSAEAMGQIQVGGLRTTALGMDAVEGEVYPPFLDGRPPRTDDEVALGGQILRRLGLAVGDEVEVAGADVTRRMRIVGRLVLSPQVVNGEIQLGEGVLVTIPMIQALAPEQSFVNVFLVRFVEGADREAALDSLRRDFPNTVAVARRPADVMNLLRVNSLPFALASLLVLLALATIGHALVTSIRRRRRDIAILKTIGFVRRQVFSTVAWQSTTLAVLAVGLGVPLGIVAGRAAWGAFVDRLGLAAPAAVPLLLLVVTPVAALLVANLVAAFPARAAARTQPAVALRSE